MGVINMLKEKIKENLRKVIIGGALISITFVGTALTYFAKNYHDKGILVFKASDSNSLSVLFCMILFVFLAFLYVARENKQIRNELAETKQLLYKLLEKQEFHYDQLMKSGTNTREIILDKTNIENVNAN